MADPYGLPHSGPMRDLRPAGLHQLLVPVAFHEVVVDHSHRLHERVADGRTNESESLLAQCPCSSFPTQAWPRASP